MIKYVDDGTIAVITVSRLCRGMGATTTNISTTLTIINNLVGILNQVILESFGEIENEHKAISLLLNALF